ncbi:MULTISPECIES: ester cyclase [Streptomyces]|uniref:ester cyclase n=1 Tax=Streptomyces TaxID=1883 RepID=UPI00163C29DA|nr:MULTISPECIES: ester cyclase [Streptomyces]MBC2878877.1 ester cyclase [Streptomyces sp. TYQ1024]UBI38935.1 ester cyclase [Streptomyces mobaraensis]UKW31514.1 ester cyclase [Streptomyces sp. TYQ1024]
MTNAKDTVRQFLLQVRSGLHPDRAGRFMAGLVRAHQVVSEAPVVVERTPRQYTEHVQEMLDAYGAFTLTVDELIAEGDRVYARWTQTGRHVGPVGDRAPTGARVTAMTSAVYRVEDGLIVEYWIQIDRQGITAQLERAAARAEH